MIFIAYLIGIGLPTLNGWLLLGLLQKNTNVLSRIEHLLSGAVIGITLSMFIVFCAHVSLHLPLSRNGFLLIHAFMFIILAPIAYKYYSPLSSYNRAESETGSLPKYLRYILYTLVTWVILKAVFAGTVFLFLTPTYLDDTLDNWNLRGKMYFEDQAISLSLPGEDPEQSRLTISSYPPAVPLIKAWLASLAGAWSDPVANGIHLFYYFAALILLACTVRRFVGKGWDLLAIYILGSLPLYLMHGTNTYADAFLSAHVLLAIAFPLRAFAEKDPARRMALLRIGAIAAALLPFTKNEGLLIYLPPLLLIGGICLGIAVRTQRMTTRDVLLTIAWYGGMLMLLVLPWLLFKWSNGLTFGNAKSFTSLAFGWQSGVVIAMVVNSFFEGNWLFLFPVLIGLLLWRRRAAFFTWSPLTAYVLIIVTGQMMIFLFTGLAIEARMQTGLARAGVQLMPCFVLLTTLLLADAKPILQRSSLAIRRSLGMLEP